MGCRCRLFSVSYNLLSSFHGGNTGSNLVRDAIKVGTPRCRRTASIKATHRTLTGRHDFCCPILKRRVLWVPSSGQGGHSPSWVESKENYKSRQILVHLPRP